VPGTWRRTVITDSLSVARHEEAPVFEEFMGIPAHPLLLHAAVVFVPLLAVLTIAYALVPALRPHTRLVLGLLALATPVAALLAKLSGDAFFQRLQSRNRVSPEYIPIIQNHQHLGTLTVYATAALAVLTLALVFFVAPRVAAATAAHGGGRAAGRPGPMAWVLGALALAAAAVALYYVYKTGDSGAKAVWNGA
jgi:hypothetical protein